MLATLVPIFNSDMSVGAYSLFAQRENMFENPHLLGSGAYDGAGSIVGIEVLNNISIDDLSSESKIFVPVTNVSLFSDIGSQFVGAKDRIVLLIDSNVKPEIMYIDRLKELKLQGFNFAIRKLPVTQIQLYKPLLDYVDMFSVDCTVADPLKLGMICAKLLPGVPLIAENIQTQEIFENLVKTNLFSMYEGDFYRIPINRQDTSVSPLKMNYLKILKIINTPNFDLTKVAGVISQDPAMTISLLNIVNKLTLNSNISSIKQATALLGQKELKRWLNTSILSNLCSDRPNEITRLSLIRAKFAENLANLFELKFKIEELFLMGLFSVLDYILDMPMADALNTVNVSKDIVEALVDRKGPLSEVLNFQLAYESADWQEVSRLLILNKIDIEAVYQAYIDSLKWYKNMFM